MGIFDGINWSEVGKVAMDAASIAAAPETGGASLAGTSFFSDAMAGAIGDLGSAAIGGGLSYLGQSSANQANAAAAQKQMDFQERMDATKYQRAVKDLSAAGLNPMMAYGSMATNAPSGSLGVGAQNALAGVGNAIANVKPSELVKRSAETRQLHATTAQSAATTQLLGQQKATSKAQEIEAIEGAFAKRQQGLNYSANSALVNTENRLKQLQIPKAANEAAAESSWWKRNVSPYMPDIKMGTQGVTSAVDAYRKPIKNYTIYHNLK